jgi:3'-phosphoadenosine 5'-phosphosulfate sulfotransferase (PAPS reductase)/FAD synthetase
MIDSQLDFLGDDYASERVEKMLENGRKIMRDAIEEYKPVAIFAGFSGGNDSVVVTHFACTEFGAAAIHCNTLIGIEESHEHARTTAARYGWHYMEKAAMPYGPPKKHKAGPRKGMDYDLTTLPTGGWQDGETAYEEFCFNFGMPGPGQHPRMYQRLKERLFFRFRKEAKQGKNRLSTVMFVTGIRHDESSRRAGYQRAVQKQGGSIWVNPFYWQDKVDFELYRDEYGLPRNPVSDIVGISGECLCGTMGSRDELDLFDRVNPSVRPYINSLEDKCESLGLPCKWATRPPKPCTSTEVQLSLFGDEPTFQPACVGCMRRSPE